MITKKRAVERKPRVSGWLRDTSEIEQWLFLMRPQGAVEQGSSRGQSHLRLNDSTEDGAVRSLPTVIVYIEGLQDPVEGTHDLYVWGTRQDPSIEGCARWCLPNLTQRCNVYSA